MNRLDTDMIRRVLDECATPDEAKHVAHWFSTPEGNMHLAQIVDDEALRIESGETPCAEEIPSEALYRRICTHLARRKRHRILLRVAAILIPCALLLVLSLRLNNQVGGIFSPTEYAEVYVPKGERIQMIFQDGTRVYLNSDTKMRYPTKFGLTKREVKLEGEAYFVVSQNPLRPFTVAIQGAKIEVLGTEFNVRCYNDTPIISVSLDQGRVSMNDGSRSFILAPSEVLTYDRNTRQGQLNHTNTSGASLWCKDILSFKDTPFAEVIRTLDRWYDVEFKVVTPRAYSYYYTLTTRESSIEEILAEMERIAPLKFRKSGKTITVDL